MVVAAAIKFTQGPNTDIPGRAVIGTVSDGVVTITNGDNTDVTVWTFTLVSVPIGSALVPGVLSGPGPVSSAAFTPDVDGAYVCELTVTDGALDTQTDRRVFGIPNSRGWLVGGFDADGPAHNYAGQSRGWAGTITGSEPMLDQIIEDLDTALPAFDGSEANRIAIATATGSLDYTDGIRVSGAGQDRLEVDATIIMAEVGAVPGGAPGAGFGKLWVRNDSPNTLVFTDDTGADIPIGALTAPTNPGEDNRIAYGSSGDLAYAAGVTTDGTELTVVSRFVTSASVKGSGLAGIELANGADRAIGMPTATSGAGHGMGILGGNAFPTSDGAGGAITISGGSGDGTGAGGNTNLFGGVAGGGSTVGGSIVFAGDGGSAPIASFLGTAAVIGELQWDETATPVISHAIKAGAGTPTDFTITTQAADPGEGMQVGGNLILNPSAGNGGGEPGYVQFEHDGTATLSVRNEVGVIPSTSGILFDAARISVAVTHGQGTGEFNAHLLILSGKRSQDLGGGPVEVRGGPAAASGTGTGIGGSATLVGGLAGDIGAGGAANVTSGAGGLGSGNSGNVNIGTGTPTEGTGGGILFTVADSVTGIAANLAGGGFTFLAGLATGTATGGGYSFTAANGGDLGGGFTFTAGEATTGSGVGGGYNFNCGEGFGAGADGTFVVQVAGDDVLTAAAGAISINAPIVQFTVGQVNPQIIQASTSAAENGDVFTVHAQNNTSTSGNFSAGSITFAGGNHSGAGTGNHSGGNGNYLGGAASGATSGSNTGGSVVMSGGNATNGATNIGGNATVAGGTGGDTDGVVIFQTSGSTRFTIAADGNLDVTSGNTVDFLGEIDIQRQGTTMYSSTSATAAAITASVLTLSGGVYDSGATDLVLRRDTTARVVFEAGVTRIDSIAGLDWSSALSAPRIGQISKGDAGVAEAFTYGAQNSFTTDAGPNTAGNAILKAGQCTGAATGVNTGGHAIVQSGNAENGIGGNVLGDVQLFLGNTLAASLIDDVTANSEVLLRPNHLFSTATGFAVHPDQAAGSNTGMDVRLQAGTGGAGGGNGGNVDLQGGTGGGGAPGGVRLLSALGDELLTVGPAAGSSSFMTWFGHIGAVSSGGDIRTPHGWDLNTNTDAAGNFTLMSWGTTGTDLFDVGNLSSVITDVRGATVTITATTTAATFTSGEIILGVNHLEFGATENSPIIRQLSTAVAGAADTLLFNSQDHTGVAAGDHAGPLTVRAGNATGGTGDGGLLTLAGGTSSGGTTGNIDLHSGGLVVSVSDNAHSTSSGLLFNSGLADVYITHGSTTGDQSNKTLSIRGLNSTDEAGGFVSIQGGDAGLSAAIGGTASLKGGDGTVDGAIGGIGAVSGGTGFLTGDGGLAVVNGGTPGATGDAGAVLIQGGAPVAGDGGAITILGSNALGTSKTGGSVGINAGNSTNAVTGASVTIGSGSSASGTNGSVLIQTGDNSTEFEVSGTSATPLIGMYGVTPVAQAADFGALTLTTGTPNNVLVDVSGSGDDTTINENFADIGDQINDIRTVLRDIGIMA